MAEKVRWRFAHSTAVRRNICSHSVSSLCTATSVDSPSPAYMENRERRDANGNAEGGRGQLMRGKIDIAAAAAAI